MKRLLLFSLLACLYLNVIEATAQVAPSYAARLQYVLDSTCDRYHIKGASCAVYVPGSGMWKGVYGESESGQPITSDMVFPLNSNTKTYVATVMLKLQEDGKLQLDDTIGKWIQGYPNINGQITVRQLLNHSSGLYSYTDSSAFADSIDADFTRIWQPADMLKFVGAPLFAPGTNWYYSNTNFLLAGMIIAQVTGKTAEQAIRAELLTPQGLGNTWFYPQETPTKTIPHFWFYTSGGMVDGQSFGYSPISFYSGANTAGALFSTAEDNALFWHKLTSGSIINPASLAEWRQTIPLNRSGSIGYGLGMFRYRAFNGHVAYEHGGTGAGAINENLVDSVTGVCISLLTNQDSADNDMLLNQVVSALHKVTLNPPLTVGAIAAELPFDIYPNPVKDRINLLWNSSRYGTLQYTITDALGHIVGSGNLDKDKRDIAIEGLKAGVYHLRVADMQAAGGGKTFTVLR